MKTEKGTRYWGFQIVGLVLYLVVIFWVFFVVQIIQPLSAFISIALVGINVFTINIILTLLESTVDQLKTLLLPSPLIITAILLLVEWFIVVSVGAWFIYGNLQETLAGSLITAPILWGITLLTRWNPRRQPAS